MLAAGGTPSWHLRTVDTKGSEEHESSILSSEPFSAPLLVLSPRILQPCPSNIPSRTTRHPHAPSLSPSQYVIALLSSHFNSPIQTQIRGSHPWPTQKLCSSPHPHLIINLNSQPRSRRAPEFSHKRVSGARRIGSLCPWWLSVFSTSTYFANRRGAKRVF